MLLLQRLLKRAQTINSWFIVSQPSPTVLSSESGMFGAEVLIVLVELIQLRLFRHLHTIPRWRLTQEVFWAYSTGRRLRKVPELAWGIIYSLWLEKGLQSPRRSWREWNVWISMHFLLNSFFFLVLYWATGFLVVQMSPSFKSKQVNEYSAQKLLWR